MSAQRKIGMAGLLLGIAILTSMISWIAISTAGVTTSADSASEIVSRLGRESFLQYCAACHGIDSRGGGPAGASLKTAPADLTAIAERSGGKFSDVEIASRIDGRSMPAAHGSREMPVWGERFSAQLGGGDVGEEAVRGQLLILLEYLRSIQRLPSSK
jgi:mono/diheme cytochrome c family protein